jgi:hypothetical protein
MTARGFRIVLLPAVALAVALAGCGSSGTKTKTVIVTTKTVTASAPSTASTTASTTAASVTATTSSSTAPPAALPTLITMGWSGVKPRIVDFSGDGGNVVTGVAWASWTAAGAIGQGTSGIQSCVPNCAQGKTKFVPTTIVLSDVVGDHFTHLIETRNGTTTVATYSDKQNWPIGAQG